MLIDVFPWLKDLSFLSMAIRIILCIICGGIVGVERGIKGKPMGMKTHIIVCMGATIAMLTNQFIVEYFEGSDPARFGAQVISGIGFLGAGAIIVTGRQKVKGLTTAAGLWTSATLGLAIGIGFYELALFGSFMIIVVETAISKFNTYMISRSNIMNVYVEFNEIGHLSKFMARLRARDLTVVDIELTDINVATGSSVASVMTIKAKQVVNVNEVIETISDIKGVKFVEKI